MKGFCLLCLLLAATTAQGQKPFQTDAVGPQRFIAAHGHEAIVMGYANSTLEAWTYPLQLVRGYEIGFRSAGNTTEIAGSTLLRRVTYEPQAITRIYAGPDYIVRERLFVPLDEQAVLFTYTVECHHAVDIVIHFTPVLDLMWPLSIGGQSTQWNADANAYILTDGARHYSAMIGSPNVTTHDQIINSGQPGAFNNQLAFTMRASATTRTATVLLAQLAATQAIPTERMSDLLRKQTQFEAEASSHYTELANNALKIKTPDTSINQQLSWAQVALDQAWVCNPVLGCGLVAGYGPSRNARRPQYDWFFAGDALIAVEALVRTGAYDHAKQALAFIAKYQDHATGMIWHEISQSADPADWASKYPYMFVHVDITYQYLIAMERYVSASGDNAFLQQTWPGIAAAYHYCFSLLNQADGLPRIPASKEGGDEQDKITDDLDLSVSWVAASSAFGRLAAWNGQAMQAQQAMKASERARAAAAAHYWDERNHSWIDGYNEAGDAILRRGDDGIRLVSGNIFDPSRSRAILNQLASADFQTDWGTRGIAASSRQFDPTGYSRGSVSAAGTAGIAAAFWSQHQPAIAFSLWSALLPWGTLDSMGHMHELLTGDYYRQQAESVPEQTWSSAAFLSATVSGLLGLGREPRMHQLEFAPHLPPNWNAIAVENVKGFGGNLALRLTRTPDGLALAAENVGAPVKFLFSPQIPLGARLNGAMWSGKTIDARLESHDQDDHAAISVVLPSGESHGVIHYSGGVFFSVSSEPPMVGEASRAIRITSVQRRGTSLVISADVPQSASPASTIDLWASEPPHSVQGATLIKAAPGLYHLIPAEPHATIIIN